MPRFENRQEAGKALGRRLKNLAGKNNLVLALPRGGIPVAYEVAKALDAPLDILAVKKIGAPGNPEFAVGAVSEDGIPFLNEDVISLYDLDRNAIRETTTRRTAELKRQLAHYREVIPQQSVEGKTTIVVDDGIATGATAEAVIRLLRHRGAARVIVAAPVAPAETQERLRSEADDVIVLSTPFGFSSVGAWYEDFSQVEDEEALCLLKTLRTSKQSKPEERHFKTKPSDETLDLSKSIAEFAQSCRTQEDIDRICKEISQARVIMLGEATHGTHEFYSFRKEISKHLIKNYGYNFIAVEGDWPDCYAVNRYVTEGNAGSTHDVLENFVRWPTWMWANHEVAEFLEWMRHHNRSKTENRKTGFYGLDVYSLFESLDAIASYASRLDPTAGEAILESLRCFDPFERDEFAYARTLALLPKGCHDDVVQVLTTLHNERLTEGKLSQWERFDLLANAHVLHHAENYFRVMVSGESASWNVRDRHMMDTLMRLLEHHGPESKGIVWAHNTHIGDYHATTMIDRGYVNLGGLARKALGRDQVCLVGFGTYEGQVLAGRSWGRTEEIMPLPAAAPGSWEDAFHAASRTLKEARLFISFRNKDAAQAFRVSRGQRAVGVVYSGMKEAGGRNFVPTVLSERYDAFVFIDRTTALRSLHEAPVRGLVPETWPMGE